MPHLFHVVPSFAIGGRETRMATIANALGPEWTHDVLALDGETAACSLYSTSLSVRIIPSPASRPMLRRLRALRRVVTASGADLLLTYNWGAMDAMAAVFAGCAIPLIHTEDGFGVDEAVTRRRRRAWMRRVLLRRSAAVVVPSRTLQRIVLGEFGVAPSKLHFIPNSVDLEQFRPGGNETWRAAAGLPSHAVVLGTVGRLRPEKNLSLLLRAFGNLHDLAVHLLIVGDGPCLADLKRETEALELQGKVTFVGYQDAARWYSCMDIFLLPSLTEQMSIALLEAMACGLPAVVTDVGDNAAVLGTSSAPFVIPSQDEQALTRSLRLLIGDEMGRALAGRANRQRAETEFSLEGMIVRYQSLYRTLTSR